MVVFLFDKKNHLKSQILIFSVVTMLLSLLEHFGLIIEHGKTEIFYFSRSHRVLNPSPLDLNILGGSILCSKDTWQYLGFIFDRKLLF